MDVVHYCTDLLPMEKEYFINGYIAGAEDMKKQVTKLNDYDTSTNETAQED
jgi:hypothetical protein